MIFIPKTHTEIKSIHDFHSIPLSRGLSIETPNFAHFKTLIQIRKNFFHLIVWSYDEVIGNPLFEASRVSRKTWQWSINNINGIFGFMVCGVKF